MHIVFQLYVLRIESTVVINSLASGWFWRFSKKNSSFFGCLTNALAPPPIALESCSTTQIDQPV